MSVDDDREGKAAASRAHATIARIAQLLDCPAEAFTDDATAPSSVKGVSELLNIWVGLDDEADRARLLAFARKLAET